MRFRRLDLSAFGSFSGVSLDLSGGKAGGLHIIYGANEAGKSTALRAISALFFGIPERTADDHTHGTKLMKVGAVLEDANGRLHTFVRRKKRKDALRDANDLPASEATLAALLGGQSEGLFSSMFGLDHVRLAQGGEALLAGEGDLGESLFEAKMGGEGTRGVLERLEAEADALFKPTGRTRPLITIALEEHRQAQKTWRETVQRPEAWEEQQAALDRVSSEKAAVEQERRQSRSELARLTRTQAVLPVVARRSELQRELSELGETRGSITEHAARYQGIAEELRQIERDLERSQQARAALRREQESLERVPEVPMGDLDVDATAEELAVERSERIQRERLSGEIGLLRSDVELLLRRVRLGGESQDLQRLRLDVERETRLRRLAREASELQQSVKDAEAKLHEEETELQAARPTNLDGLNAEGVQNLLLQVRGLSQKAFLETERARQRALVERTQQQLCVLLASLAPWQGSADALRRLELPEVEDVSDCAEHFQGSDAEHRRLEQRSRELRSASIDAARRIEAIQRAFEVPSELGLASTREKRDGVWRRIRATQGLASQSSDKELMSEGLAAEYEKLVADADELSDRLRREAQRVIELANCEAELSALGKEELSLEAERSTWKTGRMQLDQRIAELCSRASLDELMSPSAFLGWVKRAESVRTAAVTLVGIELELAACGAEYAAAQARVVEVLKSRGVNSVEGWSLTECLERAQILIEFEVQREQEARRLEQEVLRRTARIVETQRRLSEAKRALEAWAQQWAAVLEGLPFSAQAAPDEVLAAFDQLNLVFQKADELHAKERQAAEMNARFEHFRSNLMNVARRSAPEVLQLEPLAAAEELLRRKRSSDLFQDKLRKIKLELAEKEAEIERLSSLKKQLVAEVAELCHASGVSEPSQLRVQESLEERRTLLQAALAACDAELLEIASEHGLLPGELVSEAQAVERGTLQIRRQELEVKLEELDERHLALDREMVALAGGLKHFATTSGAEAAQLVQTKAVEVRSLAARYQQLQLAGLLLRRAMEEYRVRNQDPLLARASQLFAKITLGGYTTLRVGLEERVIRCVRSDGLEQEVRALSEGTRFQLYLALRLASIEAYLATNEPMPLVFDDLLLHFDDDRARVTLEVLAELSQHTQILFFTHHEHLLSLARRALKPAQRIEHRLSGPSPRGQQELFGLGRPS